MGGIDYRAISDRITDAIKGAMEILGDADSHEAATCRDRLMEALMWAMRIREDG